MMEVTPMNPKLWLDLAGRQAREAVQNRNRAIVDARECGMSLRAIGAAVGLTHVAIKKIVERESNACHA